MEKIFFQSSLPRTGSTLLQNIVAQRPDFYCTPTSGVLELIYAARSNYTDSGEFKAQDPAIMKEAFKGFCHEGLKGYYNAITDKRYILDKSRGWGIHYDFLNFVYPQPKIVCMVRDLRDIFCSMEKNFRKHPDKQDKILNWTTGQGTTTPKRIDAWLAGPPVGLAIERLNEIFRQGIDKHIHFIKYEDLCLYPQTTMTQLYQYLGIEDFIHDFDNVEQVTQEDDEIHGIFGDHTIRKKVEPLRSDAQKILGADVCKWIKDNFQWYFNRFNYK
jgi:sulfotransferase